MKKGLWDRDHKKRKECVLGTHDTFEMYRSFRLDDSGSALLTVILAVAFLTILATTLLYVTGMNFMIKQADYRNKKNFYSSETALELMKAELMEKIVSEAAREAYSQTCMSYSSAGNASVREIEYNENFVNAVSDKLNAALGSGDWTAYLSSGYSSMPDVASHTRLVMDSPSVSRDGAGELVDEEGSGGTLVLNPLEGIVTIRGLNVTYINDKSLASVISTNLELHAPEIDWTAEQSESSLLVSQEEAKQKQQVNVSRCVRYTNWIRGGIDTNAVY